MGKTTKKPRRPAQKKRKTWPLICAATLAVCILVGALGFHINASIVHLESTDLYLTDLPEAFDGTTILFVTDIHLMGTNTPGRAKALMDSLAALKPDLLLLGGDYASESIWEMMRDEDVSSALATRRREFFASIAAFPAPMGKFAVSGNHDTHVAGLESALSAGGITLLSNEAVRISLGNQSIIIAGLEDYTTGQRNIAGVGALMNQEDCVILLSHSPDALPAISSTEAANGGRWADVVLSGHTHGGQIRLFDWSPMTPSAYGEKYLSGWVQENGHLMLVSNGTGCSFLNMRWGADAQAHLITLRTTPNSIYR